LPSPGPEPICSPEGCRLLEELPAPVSPGCERFVLRSFSREREALRGSNTPSEEGDVVILHDRLGFRQPTHAGLIPICLSGLSLVTNFDRPACPKSPVVRGRSDAAPGRRGETCGANPTGAEGAAMAPRPHSLRVPSDGTAFVIVSPATERWQQAPCRAGWRSLSTGDLVHGRRVDHVLTAVRGVR